ncbi:MAG: hypothetical protein ACK4WH_10200 [Phycisphaerales bacterium]
MNHCAATIALAVSLHGPIAPRRVTRRARYCACIPPCGELKESMVEPSLMLCTYR